MRPLRTKRNQASFAIICPRAAMLPILLATILTLSALYAPQPLLPVITTEFQVSREAASLLTTITFLPLSLAPLVYGVLLEKVSPRRLLQMTMALLALSEFLFAWTPLFSLLLAIRLFQGLLIPALLTSLMTYLAATTGRAQIQSKMAIYVAATITGGFLGRAMSGLIATLWGWRYSFLVLAVSLIISFLLLFRLPQTPPRQVQRPSFKALWSVLQTPFCLYAYLMIFCLFLTFAAVMNFIPFRLTEVSHQADEFRIGLMYCGYLMGVVTSLLAVRIGHLLGRETRAILVGFAVLGLALIGFVVPLIPVLFLTMFVFCGGMFLVHSTTSGFLNRWTDAPNGVVNGLYVAFYYGGGVVGSFLPGYIYRDFGWNGFLASLFAIVLLGIVFAWKLHRASPADTSGPIMGKS